MSFSISVHFRESSSTMVIRFPTSAERDQSMNSILNSMMSKTKCIVRRMNVVIAVIDTADVVGIHAH